jgi:hypothetical protein
MESFVWIGFVAFFIASLVVGIRLVALWVRDRNPHALLIGLGVLGIGPVGFGLATVATLLQSSRPGLANFVLGTALVAISTGVTAKYLFNWRVYHPKSTAVRVLAFGAGFILLGIFVSDLVRGLEYSFVNGPTYVARTALQVGCLLWGAGEAFLYWGRMRRRMRLGLADPLVTNRFLLWGLGAWAAGQGTAIGLAVQLSTGQAIFVIPWLTLSSSLHGLTAAIAMWLAFLPTAGYRRLIETRAAAATAS